MAPLSARQHCRNGLHRAGGVCLSVLVVASLLACVRGTLAQVCTERDVKSIFTPCNTNTGQMESVQYFDRMCDNTNTSVSIRSPRPTPCTKPCDSGKFYSAATLQCEPCAPGEFSNSGGEIINTFDVFPSRFATYCNPQPCSTWQVSSGGMSLDSGNQSVGVRHGRWYNANDESVEVSMSTIINVINPRGGKLFFQYRVESEKNFDGLQLFFNGSLVANVNAPDVGTDRFFATGLHHQWRSAAIPLAPGRVDVRFVYSKDANQLSEGAKYAGADRAFLKDFTIEGVQMFAPHCTKCAPGEYADAAGAQDCKTCARDRYSTAGAQGCLRCDDNQWAPVGSGRCFPKLQCTAEDYVAVYDTCAVSPSNPNKSQRQRNWKLINSRCIETADTMPPSGYVDCAICPPGFHVNNELSCVPCPVGQMFDESTQQCTVCAPGTAAVPIVDYSGGFDFLGGMLHRSKFAISCDGLCASCPEGHSWCHVDGEGFELAPFQYSDDDNTIVGIRQDLDNGNSYTSKLSYKFHMATMGTVSLSYAYVRQGSGTGAVPASLTATVTVGGQEYLLDKYFVGPQLKGTLLVSLEGGADYEFLFTVSQSGVIAPDDMFAVALLTLTIVGDDQGAANRCTKCHRGFYCPGNTNNFIPCPLGQAQAYEGQSSCVACTGSGISKELGASFCQTCDVGTDASADHQLCVNRCNYTSGGNAFDFSGLHGVVFGPLFTPGSRTDLTTAEMDAMNIYRFFISPCSLVNVDKSADKCSIRFGSLVEDAYACQRLNSNQSYSAGDDLHYYVHPTSQQLTMRISGGDRCHRLAVDRSTNITFVCDPTQEGYGTMQFIDENPHCQYNFLYSSKYGCPVCTEDSFSRVDAECNDQGVRSITYFKKSSASQCQGGYVPPEPITTACERCQIGFYDLVWSDCVDGLQKQTYVLQPAHKGCVDDGKLQFPSAAKQQTCKKIDAKIGANGFTFSVVFILGSVSLLFYALYALYHRHTRLQVEYQRLSNNAGEMADMDDDDDLDRNNESSVPVAQPNAGGAIEDK